MTDTEILSKARTLRKRIKLREEKLEQLRIKYEYPHSVRYDTEPSQPSTHNALIGYIEIKDKLLKEIFEMEAKIEEARAIIDKLPRVEQIQVMNDFFLDGRTIKEIAKRTGYSKENIYTIIKRSKSFLKDYK